MNIVGPPVGVAFNSTGQILSMTQMTPADACLRIMTERGPVIGYIESDQEAVSRLSQAAMPVGAAISGCRLFEPDIGVLISKIAF